MLVSSVKRSVFTQDGPVVQRLAIEFFAPERPALGHPLLDARQRRFLLGRELAGARRLDGHQPRDRRAVARDDELLARLDLADVAGKTLVGVAQADGLHGWPPRPM